MISTIIFIILGAIVFLLFLYFFVGRAPVQKNITWGVNFSQMQVEFLKLDWKKTYLAILEDLGARRIKLITNWDWVEGTAPQKSAEGDVKTRGAISEKKFAPSPKKRGNEIHTYFFNDIDWQIQQAESHGASIMYVVGMKTGRWPECHIPAWAVGLSKQEQQDAILNYIEQVVTRYKGSKAIVAWQAENEPLFKFGQCPWYDKEFLKKEVALIKSLDPNRPVMVSDSGEQSFWFEAANIGDVVGTTMYRKVWIGPPWLGFYYSYPIPPVLYWRKAELVRRIFHKKVINVELQAEPWANKAFYDLPLEEQAKTMDLEKFKANVAYAKQTGLDTFYFWGTEWWFWLKEQKNQPQIWDYAREIFQK